jgi:hypothetical protein
MAAWKAWLTRSEKEGVGFNLRDGRVRSRRRVRVAVYGERGGWGSSSGWGSASRKERSTSGREAEVCGGREGPKAGPSTGPRVGPVVAFGAGGEGAVCGGSAGVDEVVAVGGAGSGTNQHLYSGWWCERLTWCNLGL